MNKDAKNKKIKETVAATRKRRESMNCRVFEVKVDASRTSRTQMEAVNTLFKEAKWRRNDIVADIQRADRNAFSAIVKVGEDYETRCFDILNSQTIQDIYDNVKSEIKGLATKKKNGEKVGALKFKSYCNSIPLRQHGVTYKIDFEKNTIKVSKIKKPFKVRGLKQVPRNAEIANAKFVRKPDGLYFHITCYVEKANNPENGRQIGVDFGISHNMTLSNGKTYDICIPESKGAKLASKRLNKALKKNGEKKGCRHQKRLNALRKAYQKDANRRKDKANKIIHELLSDYDFIAIQDELIRKWHENMFGKQVQHSAMGYIKAKLKINPKVHVVDESFPSTQICPVCGQLTKHPINKRSYQCEHCGFTHSSRDIKSASSILEEALNGVSAERRTYSPGEVRASVSDSLINRYKLQAVNPGSPIL